MTQVDECTCCAENEVVVSRLEEVGGVRCINEHVGFFWSTLSRGILSKNCTVILSL